MNPNAPWLVIGGSAFIVGLATIFGFVGQTTVVPLEISFAMQMDPTAGPEVKAWARTPSPAYIYTLMGNVSKLDPDDGIYYPADLFELFPTDDDTQYGRAIARFNMTLIDESEEPVVNKTMKMVPMIFKREGKMGMILNGIFAIATFSLNNWTLLSWGFIAGAFASLLFGIVLFFASKGSSKTVVQSIVPDDAK